MTMDQAVAQLAQWIQHLIDESVRLHRQGCAPLADAAQDQAYRLTVRLANASRGYADALAEFKRASTT